MLRRGVLGSAAARGAPTGDAIISTVATDTVVDATTTLVASSSSSSPCSTARSPLLAALVLLRRRRGSSNTRATSSTSSATAATAIPTLPSIEQHLGTAHVGFRRSRSLNNRERNSRPASWSACCYSRMMLANEAMVDNKRCNNQIRFMLLYRG